MGKKLQKIFGEEPEKSSLRPEKFGSESQKFGDSLETEFREALKILKEIYLRHKLHKTQKYYIDIRVKNNT